MEMRMQNDVDAPSVLDLDGDVDMEQEGDNDKEEDEEEEDEMEEEVVDEDEEEKEDKNEQEDRDEEEDKDDDDGKEPRTIDQGEIVITSADDVDTMAHNRPIVLPEEGPEVCEYTPRPQPLELVEWEIHTLEDMKWNDNHQHPIKYWSQDCIKRMSWLMQQPVYAEHVIYAPQCCFNTTSAKVQIDYRLRYAHTRTRAAHSKLPVDPCATRSV
jgi:hypothetical protein